MNDIDRQELVRFRIAKAEETLEEIPLHMENYAVSALLVSNKIKTTTHAGTRQMLFEPAKKFNLHHYKFTEK